MRTITRFHAELRGGKNYRTVLELENVKMCARCWGERDFYTSGNVFFIIPVLSFFVKGLTCYFPYQFLAPVGRKL